MHQSPPRMQRVPAATYPGWREGISQLRVSAVLEGEPEGQSCHAAPPSTPIFSQRPWQPLRVQLVTGLTLPRSGPEVLDGTSTGPMPGLRSAEVGIRSSSRCRQRRLRQLLCCLSWNLQSNCLQLSHSLCRAFRASPVPTVLTTYRLPRISPYQ